MNIYQDYQLKWKGQVLVVRWRAEWLSDIIGHLEIKSADKTPHPLSETGYLSHFCHREKVEEMGGAIAYVRAWLESEDDGNCDQLSLF